MNRATPRITHTTLQLTAAGPRYEHHHRVEHAPWHRGGTTGHRLPKHVQTLIDREIARHEAIHVTDGTTEVHLTPVLRGILIRRNNAGWHEVSVHIVWLSEQGIPLDGLQYVLDYDAGFHKAHERHIRRHEQRIPVSLKGAP